MENGSGTWNPSETLFMFLCYVSDLGIRDNISFEHFMQSMQDFSNEYNLPPTRDNWIDEVKLVPRRLKG